MSTAEDMIMELPAKLANAQGQVRLKRAELRAVQNQAAGRHGGVWGVFPLVPPRAAVAMRLPPLALDHDLPAPKPSYGAVSGDYVHDLQRVTAEQQRLTQALGLSRSMAKALRGVREDSTAHPKTFGMLTALLLRQ